MFKEIVPKEEVKFNDLEKKIYKFVCFLGCMIIKLVLESYDRNLMKARDKKKYRHKGLKKNTAEGGIYQKDEFHIMQEIVRDVLKEYREMIKELVKTKNTKKCQKQ